MSLPVWRSRNMPTESTSSGLVSRLCEVGVMPQPREHADRAVEALGHVAGVLQRFPRALEEVAVLRIHDRRFFGLKPKNPASNRSMSSSDARAPSRSRDCRAASPTRPPRAARRRCSAHRLDAVAHVSPERVGVGRAGEAARHADDGDVVVSLRCRSLIARGRPGAQARLPPHVARAAASAAPALHPALRWSPSRASATSRPRPGTPSQRAQSVGKRNRSVSADRRAAAVPAGGGAPSRRAASGRRGRRSCRRGPTRAAEHVAPDPGDGFLDVVCGRRGAVDGVAAARPGGRQRLAIDLAVRRHAGARRAPRHAPAP